jgi:hypothetical protein
MNTIDRVVPVLARTVVAVAIICMFGAGFAAYTFGEPRLLGFLAFAFISGAYARKVTKQQPSVARIPESRNDVRPMAA